MAKASVERHGNGWRVVWRRNGQKIHTTVWPDEDTAKQAQLLVMGHRGQISKDEVHAMILGENAAPQESTAPLVKDWLESYLGSKTRITPGTKQGYEADGRLHILPTFGGMHLDEVTGVKVGEWINALRDNGYKNTSITRYFSLLSSLFEAAIREKLIDENPCENTDFIRDQVDHDDEGVESAVYLEKVEYRILLQSFPYQYQKLIECLFGTGARWSEATALAVEDLIPPLRGRRPKIRIRRAWKRNRETGPYLGTTKGRKRRTIPITTALWRSLLALTEGKPRAALLFCTATGGRIEYGNFYKQVWCPSVARAMRCAEHPPADRGEITAEHPRRRCRDFGGTRDDGKPCGQWTKVGWTRCVDHVGPAVSEVSHCACDSHLKRRPTPHDARHTHAAWLLSAGVQPVAVQRRLGHERLETTTEIYGGLMPEVDEDVIAALETGRSRADRIRAAGSPVHRRTRRSVVVRHAGAASGAASRQSLVAQAA